MLTAVLPTLALAAEEAAPREPLSPGWAPLLVPGSFLAPGLGHLLRGERKAGGLMLGISGVAMGVSTGAGLFLGFSGASDVASAVGVPLLLAGVGTLLLLGVTDLVGAFAGDGAPPLADTWSARWRVSAAVLAPVRAGAEPTPELLVSWRSERWLVHAKSGLTVGGPGPWVEGGGGVRVLSFGGAEPRAGLWLEAGLRYQWLDSARLLRSRAQLVSALPMGRFAANLSRVTTVLRLGVDPTWVWYPGRSSADFELPISGGFEARVVLTEQLRLVAGYEHARDGPLGGIATGFLGNFHGGAELALLPSFIIFARGTVGNPNGFTLGMEWRR